MRPQLFVCLLLYSDALTRSVEEILNRDRYLVSTHRSIEAFFTFVEQEKQQIDCLVLEESAELLHLANRLHRQITLLPAVIVQAKSAPEKEALTIAAPSVELPANSTVNSPDDEQIARLEAFYHTAEVKLSASEINYLPYAIDEAIQHFLKLSPACRLTTQPSGNDLVTDLTTQNFLLLQQRRLAEKLKERLGYLGVYYRRRPQNFFRHLPAQQQQELLNQLRREYQDIVLTYFNKDDSPNQKIDEFVNTAFFADISVSQIVEVHMDLIDEFSKQLKLEGRSEEILLDYRLTLIDVIAHLCEMYRRSIPREA